MDHLETTEECCEEEIVKDGDEGFHAGDTLDTKLNKDCTTATANINPENATIKLRLSGWHYSYVRVFICTCRIKIETHIFSI